MKIINFKAISGAGALIGKFDVEFKPLTVRGMGLFRRDNGHLFISEPSEKYTKKTGETGWFKHVVITDEAVKERIEALVRELVADADPLPKDDTIPF